MTVKMEVSQNIDEMLSGANHGPADATAALEGLDFGKPEEEAAS